MSGDPLYVRKLRADDAEAMRLAVAAGPHGTYVQNALAAGQQDGLLFHRGERPCGVAWFGPRGNLVLIGDESFETAAVEVVRHVQAAQWPWRIVLGAAAIVDLLRSRMPRPVLAHRDQVYYLGDASTVTGALVRDDVRSPERRDRERLARATLLLNEADLNIPPARVDRRWLYDMIDERIAEGSTAVLGPLGRVWSKLDIGSEGPGGAVLEGVFTFADRRGRGFASELVATTIARRQDPVSLHVAEANTGARRAYERAGMREVGRCRLLLLG